VPDTTALVLAGGAARRFEGRDKAALVLGGRTLLDRVLAAAPDGPAVVVGPPRRTGRAASFVREQPPGGGPLAALAAGLAHVRTPWVLLLAADLPFLTAAAVAALRDAVAGHDAAMAVDDAGRDQPLLSLWRADVLRAALPEQVTGGRLQAALTGHDTVRVLLPGHPPPWWDCDTPAAWEQARQWAGDAPATPLA
jgi:molybdopterin-guanine dinucleotide biosynthesis protein A